MLCGVVRCCVALFGVRWCCVVLCCPVFPVVSCICLPYVVFRGVGWCYLFLCVVFVCAWVLCGYCMMLCCVVWWCFVSCGDV